MAKDFFVHAFDEGTLVKLKLYENYLKAWLPVFVKAGFLKTINIFDFFCGTGYDKNKVKGSPMITIDALPFHFPDIISKKLNVNLYFNDSKKKVITALKKNVEELNLDKKPYDIHFENLDFNNALELWLAKMTGCANLILMDQFGVKHITPEVFKIITAIPKSDFLFFVSSETFHRFGEEDSIFRILNISREQISGRDHYQIHRIVFEKYKSFLPKSKTYYLAPFSIKKPKTGNIYGLIFGSNHLFAMEKFLTATWSMDDLRGEANFDIYKEGLQTGQLGLFEGKGILKSSKLEAFEKDLEEKVLSGKLLTDRDICIYSITNEFLGKHARPVLIKLKNEKRIDYKNISLTVKKAVNDKTREPVKIIIK